MCEPALLCPEICWSNNVKILTMEPAEASTNSFTLICEDGGSGKCDTYITYIHNVFNEKILKYGVQIIPESCDRNESKGQWSMLNCMTWVWSRFLNHFHQTDAREHLNAHTRVHRPAQTRARANSRTCKHACINTHACTNTHAWTHKNTRKFTCQRH